MTKPRNPGTVPFHRKAAYAAPAFGLAVVGIPVYVYLPKFYTDVVGVHIGILGSLILAVRLFDAATDPALGFVSDRTKTRFGRRRPYIGGFSLLLAANLYLLFNPPEVEVTLSVLGIDLHYILELYSCLVIIFFGQVGLAPFEIFGLALFLAAT